MVYSHKHEFEPPPPPRSDVVNVAWFRHIMPHDWAGGGSDRQKQSTHSGQHRRLEEPTFIGRIIQPSLRKGSSISDSLRHFSYKIALGDVFMFRQGRDILAHSYETGQGL